MSPKEYISVLLFKNDFLILAFRIVDSYLGLAPTKIIKSLSSIPFNEELQKDTNKLSKILTDNLLGGEIPYTGKVDINNETLDYFNFYHIKDNTDLVPAELYFIMETPITGVSYNMITIQCNNESMGQYDYLFNKILKKRD